MERQCLKCKSVIFIVPNKGLKCITIIICDLTKWKEGKTEREREKSFVDQIVSIKLDIIELLIRSSSSYEISTGINTNWDGVIY